MSSLPTPQQTTAFIDQTLRGQIDPAGTGAYDNAPGSDNAALISVLTKVATQIYAYAADRKAASIGSSASGIDLDTIIRDVYFDSRQPSNASSSTVYLQRTGTLPATSITQGSRFGTPATSTQPAIVFGATKTLSVPQGQSYVAVPVKCLQAGAVTQVLQSAITQILDPLGDATWVVYTPAPGDPVLAGGAIDVVAGGQDQESDPQAKARVLGRPAQAAPGTKAGVYKGATATPGIASAVPVEPGDGTGIVFCGDQNYLLSALLQQAVAANLESWRAFGVPVAVRPMTVVTVQITGTVYMQKDLSNYDQNALLNNAVAAVLNYFNFLRARPEEYFINRVAGAIGDANIGTQSVVLTSPAADVKRPADSTYGTVSSLTRYVTSAQSINLTFSGPLTQ